MMTKHSTRSQATASSEARDPAQESGAGHRVDRSAALTWRPVALEEEILATFDAPTDAEERRETAFQRKELALMALFERLSVADAHELHRRLTLQLADDPITTRAPRLIRERRERLLDFLADARRREALRNLQQPGLAPRE